MNLTARAFALIALTAALAIVAIWSGDPLLAPLWVLPTALFFVGLAVEGFFMSRTRIAATVEIGRSYLGRPAPAAFVFRNETRMPSAIEYVPAVPAGLRYLPGTRRLAVPADESVRDLWEIVPERLGTQVWPPIPARLRGVLGLMWWARKLSVEMKLSVAPDLFGAEPRSTAGESRGVAVSLSAGAGAELKQLREYQPGDPLHRIDWKATARRGAPVTREFIEDQHLEIVLAIDAGRTSRLEAGRLNRLGLFANVAARFAQHAVLQDDRVGLMVFADRPLTIIPPARGLSAVTGIRAALERMSSQAAESSTLAAALRIRGLVRHRSLVVLLTDPGESTPAEELMRAVRLLQTRHFVIVAAVVSEEIEILARTPAKEWVDSFVALAAKERQVALRGRVGALRRLGASVVTATAQDLDRAVLDEYRRLRKQRRV